jgi:hypothetical protein
VIKLPSDQKFDHVVKVSLRFVESIFKISFRLENIHFYILSNTLLLVGTQCSCEGPFPGKEGKIQGPVS